MIEREMSELYKSVAKYLHIVISNDAILVDIQNAMNSSHLAPPEFAVTLRKKYTGCL
jgi:hypothetical protein